MDKANFSEPIPSTNNHLIKMATAAWPCPDYDIIDRIPRMA